MPLRPYRPRLPATAEPRPRSHEVGAVSSAFVLGGTGQIGQAAARRLVEGGWDVTVASRGERDLPEELEGQVTRVTIDRTHAGALEQAVGDGVDVLVDVIPFGASDAEQLLALGSRVGSVIAVSSASVYTDEEGRSMDAAEGALDLPELPLPIPESQPTVLPGDDGYSAGKSALELALLGQSRVPATVIRPCAIYGRGDRQAREWHFVKRVVDGRRDVVLAYEGRSRFHTTSAENLAELIRCCADQPGTRVFNSGDPDPPTLAEIARAIADALAHDWEEHLIPGEPEGTVGRTPWSVPDVRPIVVDMTAAERRVGYRAITNYQDGVAAACEWLIEATRDKDWREVLVGHARYYGDLFDYAAEDEYLSRLRS